MTVIKSVDSLIIRNKIANPHAPIGLDFRRFSAVGGQLHVCESIPYSDAGKKVEQLHAMLLEGKNDLLLDKGTPMIGWKTTSPFISTAVIDDIRSTGRNFANLIDIFSPVGIGGSFLGSKSAMEVLLGSLSLFNLLPRDKRGGAPQILPLGQNMDSGYLSRVLEVMEGKRVGTNVISKSGGTVEPAIAFAILKYLLEANCSPEEARRRIVATTDKQKGALKELSDKMGYQTYVVPDNVGGRYSVTSMVGLFPLAVAGIDIGEFIAGAKFAEEQTRNNPFDSNIAMQRAVMRFIAHKFWGKKIEVASTGIYDLRGVTSWMQQLGPESEGKNGEGLWFSPEYYTEMAHANGQMIQQGERNMIETFLLVNNPNVDVIIKSKDTPVEYLDGKTLHFANSAFIDGLRDAHYNGDVPIMSYVFPHLNAFTLGMFYQYEMNAIALSALLLGQNPFIQPGVEAYKHVANAYSGKPGTEADLNKMREAEKKLDPRFII